MHLNQDTSHQLQITINNNNYTSRITRLIIVKGILPNKSKASLPVLLLSKKMCTIQYKAVILMVRKKFLLHTLFLNTAQV